MKSKPGLWRSLEALPTLAAVLNDWKRELGDEFARARPFLEETPERSADHPCTNRPDCGCVHRVAPPGKRTGLVAGCECGCPPIRLQDNDLIVHELADRKLGEEVRRAMGFERMVVRGQLNRKLGEPMLIGTAGSKRNEVFLCCRGSYDAFAEFIDQRFLWHGEPCLLVTPTSCGHTDILRAKLKRLGCGILALSETVIIKSEGRLECVADIEAVVNSVGQVGSGSPSVIASPNIIGDPARATERITLGTRIKYFPGFNDVWIDDEAYDLRKWKKARLCLQFLVESKAFDADSGKHLVDEIDPYVRRHGHFDRSAEIKIHHYFNDGGPVRELCRQIIRPVGRDGRYFLKVE